MFFLFWNEGHERASKHLNIHRIAPVFNILSCTALKFEMLDGNLIYNFNCISSLHWCILPLLNYSCFGSNTITALFQHAVWKNTDCLLLMYDTKILSTDGNVCIL